VNRAQKLQEIEILEELVRRQKANYGLTTYENFYPFQRRLNALTAEYRSVLLMAANQVGKSLTGCTIDAFHLTGDYPDDWEGHKFTAPPMCWLLGFSGEKTRDLLQLKLFGQFRDGKFEGGLVPADRILDWRAMTGTTGAMREVRVKHTSGISTCQFWSYNQGQHALMGDVVDWYHVDEEPRDQQIYPQLITRTLNGDQGRGGRGILTFTPENGKTETVCSFMDDPSPSQAMLTATWKDAPHITKEMQEELLAQYPAYQRDMRSKGTPLMGSGLIYEHDEEVIGIEPFKIPDYWFIIDGMDFGWDHPQAHVQMVEDRDAGIFYIVNAWKASKKQPFEAWHIIKRWAEGVPTAWPHDGLKGQLKSSGSQNDGDTQIEMYANEGFLCIDEHASWEEGGNSVQRGIVEFNQMLAEGRLRIFNNLHEFFEEMRQYHTKTNPSGQTEIVKIKDDLLDAARYAYMMRRYAIRICDIGINAWNAPIEEPDGRDELMGY